MTASMTIIADRLDWLAGASLARGQHTGIESGACAMEAAAYIAGEPWSDHPECVSPAIAAFMRAWNDGLPGDAERGRLLKPLIPIVIGTATGAADDERRSWMALDWLVRVHTPAWLRLAGLDAHADTLAGLAEIVDHATCDAARPALSAARAAAWDAARAAAGDAAWAAAWDAAGAAAGDAAWDATRAAAGDAAWDATRAAAGDAAWAAARAAARAASRDASRDASRAAAGDAAWAAARAELQGSAADLVRAMCEVGRDAAMAAKAGEVAG